MISDLMGSLEKTSVIDSMRGVSNVDFRTAVRIRLVEEKFLSLFAEGKMSGTVHTCVGQEFSALAVMSGLKDCDWVTSNHRCHGHFIAKTGMWERLIAELMGDESGVCKGVGSSQHLYADGFLSNGTQGSLLPVGGGIANQLKQRGGDGIVTSFIGEGTLGEGVLYEALNLATIFNLPQLFVCENNFYSQSTPQVNGVAGSISGRAQAFGMKVFEAGIWDLSNLYAVCLNAVNYVRSSQEPAFLVIQCYRLNAHSKGDDDRPQEEVDFFKAVDPLTNWLSVEENRELENLIRKEVDAVAEGFVIRGIKYWDIGEYSSSVLCRNNSVRRKPFSNNPELLSKVLNGAYRNQLITEAAIFVGEDIADPYGGAFKITKGFSTEKREQVFSTPISEAGLTGFAIGNSLMGTPAYAEIMFGDFILNAGDQIVNNACKFHHMYAHQVCAPVKIRVAMGGGRGYGPTHSQSLEKTFLGVESLSVVAPTSLRDPSHLINDMVAPLKFPCLIVENKVDYGRRLASPMEGLLFEEIGGPGGTIAVRPEAGRVGLVIVSYGGMARQLYDWYEELFKELDVRIELLAPQLIHPIPLAHIERSVAKTGALLVVEEGVGDFGWGSQLVAQLHRSRIVFAAEVVGALPVSIPSPRILEQAVIPSLDQITAAARRVLK